MPLHARVLSVMLAINVALALVPLAFAFEVRALFNVAVAALMLFGFLRGSEGVRTLLMIGAAIGLFIGGFTLFVALAAGIASGGIAGLVIAAVGGWNAAAAAYMLWALRNEAVQKWMLERSLGMDLDDAG